MARFLDAAAAFSFFFFFACRRRGLSFCFHQSAVAPLLRALFYRATQQTTNLGHRVATVLGVARTLLVRRLDDEADGARGDDRRSDRDAGAVEAGASGPGRRRGQARRPDEGGGEHSSSSFYW